MSRSNATPEKRKVGGSTPPLPTSLPSKRVDPISGTGLYHGLIQIPGVTSGLQRLQDLVGRTFTVAGNGGYLVLGYQDDGYSDNGYYAHDDGTDDQCRNSVNAWVHLTIDIV